MIFPKPKIVVIVGPTASGKSDLAVLMGRKFSGEVVSADSRQVYRGLNIGTGKITPDEMLGIPHHLLDVASAEDVFTVSDYKQLAQVAISEIIERNNLPIICGGTGFYIQALVDGIELPNVPPNERLRESLEPFSASALYEKLKELDSEFADIVDRNNPHRLIRAIEIATALGHVPKITSDPPYDACFVGISTDLYTLRERIHTRLLSRIESGMIDEVKMLHEGGLSFKRMDSLGLEYRYVARHLEGKLDLEEMLTQLENEIFQYAKRQLTWFKRDGRISWFEKDDSRGISEYAEKHLNKKPADAG